MRTLFAKFLLWFWLGLAAMLVVEIALETNSLERGLSVHPTHTGGPYEVLAGLARATLSARGTVALDSLLRQFDASGNVECLAIEASGVTLDGRTPSTGARQAGLSALRTGHGALVETATGLYLGYPIGRLGTRELAVVLHPLEGEGAESRERGAHGWPPFLPEDLAVRALAMLAIAGVGCFLLVRYITSPVTRLRHATRLLAEGDLSARVGSAKRRRRDEIEDLGRDFDRMAERLEALLGAQRRLLTDISHELRSPLARMNVALALLRQRGAPDDDGMLARLEIEAERLNRLLGDALTLSRSETGEPVPAFQRVDLGALAEEVAGDARFEAGARGGEVRLERSGEPATLGVPELLRSAIENVVRNAVRHTRPGGAVEILVSSRGEAGTSHAVVEVRDEGDGLPEDQYERIFEPFYRFEGSSGPGASGTGLGLAIAKRVVLRHSGSIRASAAPGGGLAITITLPASDAT